MVAGAFLWQNAMIYKKKSARPNAHPKQ